MLSYEERNQVEKSLLASLFNSNYSINLILSVRNEELFSIVANDLVFEYIKKYYYSKEKAPSSPTEIYELILLDNKKVDNKIFTDISRIDVTSDVLKLTDKLIDDNLEKDVVRIDKEANDKKLNGYEKAIFLSDRINQAILKAEGYNVKSKNNIELVEDLLQKIKHIKENGAAADYIPTGIESLDKKIIGIPKGHITIIAARPGMGKTATMLQLMRNIILQKLKVGIISIEMETESLILRNLSAYSEIDSMKLENGDLSEDDFNILIKSSKPLAYENYVIDDSPYQSAETIKARISNWKNQGKVDIVFLDYLTLVSTKNRYKRFDLEIGALTGELRTYAKETGIPIVILSQLNRSNEGRINKKPMLSDLRESGSIEQDAKTVLLLYVPAIYGINPFENGATYVDENGNLLSDDSFMEIIIAKARNGKIGTVPVQYLKHIHQIKQAIKKNDDCKINYSYDEEYPV